MWISWRERQVLLRCLSWFKFIFSRVIALAPSYLYFIVYGNWLVLCYTDIVTDAFSTFAVHTLRKNWRWFPWLSAGRGWGWCSISYRYHNTVFFLDIISVPPVVTLGTFLWSSPIFPSSGSSLQWGADANHLLYCSLQSSLDMHWAILKTTLDTEGRGGEEQDHCSWCSDGDFYNWVED